MKRHSVGSSKSSVFSAFPFTALNLGFGPYVFINTLEEIHTTDGGVNKMKHSALSKTKYVFIFHCFHPGSEFLCNTHIIPVKNEEGVVMMFILNFDCVLDEDSNDSTERLNLTPPAKSDISKSLTGAFHFLCLKSVFRKCPLADVFFSEKKTKITKLVLQ